MNVSEMTTSNRNSNSSSVIKMNNQRDMDWFENAIDNLCRDAIVDLCARVAGETAVEVVNLCKE